MPKQKFIWADEKSIQQYANIVWTTKEKGTVEVYPSPDIPHGWTLIVTKSTGESRKISGLHVLNTCRMLNELVLGRFVK